MEHHSSLRLSLLGGRATRAVALVASCLLGLLSSTAHASTNLVVNGGFETGNFSGWVVSDTSLTNAGTDQPHSGLFEAKLGNRSVSTISQSISTVAGTSYTVDLFVGRQGSIAGGDAFSFSGSFAGSTFFSLDASALPLNSPYSEFTATIAATSSSSLLVFTYVDQPSYILLDDVSVLAPAAPVPEPSEAILLLFGLAAVFPVAKRLRAQ